MKINLSVFFLIFNGLLHAQPHNIYLIGDAGKNIKSGKALLMLKQKIENDDNSTVLFLGDNVYPDGFSFKDSLSVLKMQSQLSILKKYKGNAFFVPGNHDWSAEKRDGLKKITEQQLYVNKYINDSTIVNNKNDNCFLPSNALPGPQSVMVGKSTRIVFIDTQWFLHYHKKNKIKSVKETKAIFYKKLDSILNYANANNEKVIIAAHHPIYTNGNHSSKRQPLRFLVNYTPLKILGWMGLDRVLSQDIDATRYKKMRKQFLELFNKYSNIIYVCGHDHNIQYFKMNNNKYIVSGCGSKTSKLKNKTRFTPVYQSDDTMGFVKLVFDYNSQVKIEIYKVGDDVIKID